MVRKKRPRGGRAWRGWFPLGGQLTSGAPDLKEGFYFGDELPPDDARPMHGPNLFPPGALRDVVLAYLEAQRALGQRLMSVLAQNLASGCCPCTMNLTRPTARADAAQTGPADSTRHD